MVVPIQQAALAYVAIPKAGSSSVKAMLATADPRVTLPSPEQITNRTYHSLYRTRQFDEARFDKHRDKGLFTVVRDPIKRLMSVYTNRVIDNRDMQRSRGIGRRGDLPVEPDPDFFFQKIRRYARRSKLINHHILPVSAFTGPDLDRFFKVFRTDQMGEIATFLTERLGKPIVAAKANSSSASLGFDDLKPQTRDHLRPYLMREYQYLDGYFDNPMA